MKLLFFLFGTLYLLASLVMRFNGQPSFEESVLGLLFLILGNTEKQHDHPQH